MANATVEMKAAPAIPQVPTNTPIPESAIPSSPARMVTLNEQLDAAINKAAGVATTPATTNNAPASGEGKVAAAPVQPVAAPAAAAKPAAPAQPANPPNPPAAEGTAKPAKKEGIAELREAHERNLAKLKELEAKDGTTARQLSEAYAKIAETEGKVASYEKRVREEFEPQVKRLTEVEKRLQEREERLRIADYQASDEFHTQYVRPLAEARAEADAFMNELTVATGDGNERPATKADLDTVLAQPNHTQAAKLAKALFGEETYQSVLNHRMKLLSLDRSRTEAVKNAHLASAEWVERNQAAQAQARQQFRSSLSSKISEMLASDETFKVAEDDAEAKAAIDEGREFAESLLDPPAGSTPEQVVEMVSKAQHRVRAYPRQLQTIRRLNAEVTNLKQRLRDYETSEPQVETRMGGGTTAAVASGSKEEAGAALMQAIMQAAGR